MQESLALHIYCKIYFLKIELYLNQCFGFLSSGIYLFLPVSVSKWMHLFIAISRSKLKQNLLRKWIKIIFFYFHHSSFEQFIICLPLGVWPTSPHLSHLEFSLIPVIFLYFQPSIFFFCLFAWTNRQAVAWCFKQATPCGSREGQNFNCVCGKTLLGFPWTACGWSLYFCVKFAQSPHAFSNNREKELRDREVNRRPTHIKLISSENKAKRWGFSH